RVKFVRNKLGEPDKSGRRGPEPIPGSEFVIPCDNVLLALSQNPDTTWLADVPEFRVKRARDLGIDAETYQSVVPKIFFAGDYRTGPTTIIEAVADGRSAAQQIARFLDPIAIAVNVPEYHEIVTLRRSSTPDNVGQIALEGELARIYHNMSVDYDRLHPLRALHHPLPDRRDHDEPLRSGDAIDREDASEGIDRRRDPPRPHHRREEGRAAATALRPGARGRVQADHEWRHQRQREERPQWRRSRGTT